MYLKAQATTPAAPAISQTHWSRVGCTRPHIGHLKAERGMRLAHFRQRLTGRGLGIGRKTDAQSTSARPLSAAGVRGGRLLRAAEGSTEGYVACGRATKVFFRRSTGRRTPSARARSSKGGSRSARRCGRASGRLGSAPVGRGWSPSSRPARRRRRGRGRAP
jgi:hypothetical protein